jgi:plasmid stabilization system protein ParE
MADILVQEAASWRLDETYRHTRDRWGQVQAERCITGLFEAFERIGSRGVAYRPVPAELGVQGYFFRYERHFVYWRRLGDDRIGMATILHERMHLLERFRDDLPGGREAT